MMGNPTKRVLINGEAKEFPLHYTLSEIMQSLTIQQSVAVLAFNGTVVRAESWGEISPSDGDEIELLQFVGGGS